MHAPGGTCYLADAGLGSALYVREAYTALHQALEELKKEGIAHVVISGNEGVGKSWFARYMLMRWGLLHLLDRLRMQLQLEAIISMLGSSAHHSVPCGSSKGTSTAHQTCMLPLRWNLQAGVAVPL